MPKLPLPVLMYHGCDENALRDDFELIKRQCLEPVHLGDPEVARYLMDPGAAPYPDHKVVLTFDDGLENFFEVAYPLLAEFDFQATVCVPTGYVSESSGVRKKADWTSGPCLPTMTWDELIELANVKNAAGRPLFEIIPHSVCHTNLDEIKDDKEKLRCEIRDSKLTLSAKLGLAIDNIQFFCLPYGAGWGKAEIEKVLGEEGYDGVLRADYRDEGWNRYCIPRWEVCPPPLEVLWSNLRGILNRSDEE